VKLIDPKTLKLDPKQAARHSPETIRRLAANIRQLNRLLQPIGVCGDRVCWGHCRVQAYMLAKPGEPIPAIDLPKDMTEQEYLLMQLAENLLHNKPSQPELTDQIAAIKETGLTQKEIGQRLGYDEGWVSRLLDPLKLPPRGLELYRAGKMNASQASGIVKAPSDQMHAMIEDIERGMVLTREAIRQRSKPASNGKQVKAASIRIRLPNGNTVTVSGPNLTLDAGIDSMDEARRLAEKGRKEGLTAKTISKVSAERARAGN
jgi:ParB-like chromosome segregation protein Spo0J